MLLHFLSALFLNVANFRLSALPFLPMPGDLGEKEGRHLSVLFYVDRVYPLRHQHKGVKLLGVLFCDRF